MTVLTIEQKDFLKENKKNLYDLRLLVIEKYTPPIFENIKEFRETIRNLSITSGAVGALTVSLLDKGVVKNKSLTLSALLIFLFVVWEGFLYLKFVLEKENNQLNQTTEKLHEAITNAREQIDKALRGNSQEEALKVPEAFERIEGAFRIKDRVDNWFVRNIGDLTFIPFTIACTLMLLSFVELDC